MFPVMRKQHSIKAGLPPGSLVFVGERRVETTSIQVMTYSEDLFSEFTASTPQEAARGISEASVTWINIIGLHDTGIIQQAGDEFAVHPLVLEDIVNTGQRPKFEDQGNLLFMVLRMLYRQPPVTGAIISEQVSLLIGRNVLVTFQEMEADVFDTIRNRIRAGGGRIRQMGADYLAYALLDAIVDNYFSVLEDLDEKIESAQQSALEAPVPATLHHIHNLKRELVSVRRHLWPLREAVSAFHKSDSTLLTRDLTPYLHDVHEHTFQVLDTLESMREMISSALETYMSSVSNRMNEIMKVLTIISTIFIPLTFIAGIYGMNFEYMPELSWPLGYAATLGFMGITAAAMVMFFKRRHWL